ncbi:hypothetical protein EMO92_05745 [Bifidobacterium reuteri]|uniref:Uncharacterized protein n=1 Tax=Bifidobacterium reuteri TaxID=983706 RepID=A0A5J5E8P3_9BIFI|nr:MULTISPECIES: hypothetical protein [Bifidobacterium]KAA8818544.1 hypothetical protein CSQ85_08610 [Bifidobacterium rousetti]KAA8825391.1 hypothetical protein EMO92_05745 [Bifidobacterium reuteri]
MEKSTHNTSVQNGGVRRLVVILVCASIALQALAFAIPGDVLGLLCRAVGVLLLVMALLTALKGGAKSNSFLAIGFGVAAGLAAVALVIALL